MHELQHILFSVEGALFKRNLKNRVHHLVSQTLVNVRQTKSKFALNIDLKLWLGIELYFIRKSPLLAL